MKFMGYSGVLAQGRLGACLHSDLVHVIWALVAVAMFSLTAPFTKALLEVFSPSFIAAFRGGLAGLGALFWLIVCGVRAPNRKEGAYLLLAGLCVAVVFPHLINVGLTELSASEMGVALAGLPVATSVSAWLLYRETHSWLFWAFSFVGALLLLVYFWVGVGGEVAAAGLINDGAFLLLLTTVLVAGVGYAAGARVAKTLGAWPAICWMLVLYLPLNLMVLGDILFTRNVLVAGSLSDLGVQDLLYSLFALLYLALISQWYGFKFWYGAMAVLGTARIAQLQLLQPFMTMAFAFIVLQELPSAIALLFASMICITLFASFKAEGKSWYGIRKV